MNWQWAVDRGLIQGDASYYSDGRATGAEYSKAVQEAYKNSSGEDRKQLVDMLWSTGTFKGDPSYWYEDRTAEVGSLGKAAEGMAPATGTGPEGTKPRFGIAGGAQLWKNTDTGESYIVYQVPGTEDDPVYMRWTVPSQDDVQSFFGPGQPVVYQQQLPGTSPMWGDAVDFGSSTDIANTAKNPFDSWSSTLEVEAAIQPWILDDDYQKLLAMSVVENRPLTEAEIASTKWYKEHSDAERNWMATYHGDPATAAKMAEDMKSNVRNDLIDSGISDPDDRLVDYLADRRVQGIMSETEYRQQVQILSDPYFEDVPLNEEFRSFIADNGISYDRTSDRENEVRDTVNRWLGTNFGSWSDEEVSYWAGRLRNEPDAAEALVETLKDQRLALFPQYDREADYQTIASPWRTMMRNLWGEVPNDSDMMLQNIINMNSAGEAGKLLTAEGLKRGNDNVVNSVQTAITNTFGGI